MRKLTILFAALALASVFAGCGSKEAEEDPKVLDAGLKGMNPEAKAKEGGPSAAGEK